MALTFDVIRRVHLPAGNAVVVDITFDNSYPTGGESFAPSDIGGFVSNAFDLVRGDQKVGASRICNYDYTNKKLILSTALGTEAANASDQSTIVVRAFCIGDQLSGLEQ